MFKLSPSSPSVCHMLVWYDQDFKVPLPLACKVHHSYSLQVKAAVIITHQEL